MGKPVAIRKGSVAILPTQKSPFYIPAGAVELVNLSPALRAQLERAKLYDAVVGSATQVGNYLANYTSIVAALSAFPTGNCSILVLPGSVAESPTIGAGQNNVLLEGMGNSSIVTGLVTCNANNCIIKGFRSVGGFALAGQYNFLKECWMPLAAAFTDTGTDNVYELIRELT